ncbi:MAG: 3-hydroxyacyl-CoA dehydrogenase family protein [Elusimicrobia bacterium]|nr:3-hydroxyacyl-CoA dehydrogenase family protein [Elusimicrobiota bacterium]
MEFNQRLKQVAVIGAAGKMGRGISAMIAHQMALLKAQDASKDIYRLYLIDTMESGLDDLFDYIEQQARKQAEQGIVELRRIYSSRKDLIENLEIIEAHLNCVKKFIRPGVELSAAANAKLVFEAIVEDLKVKQKVYESLAAQSGREAFFLTNTSSIPINALEKSAGLEGRIIGYHFYNPPPVQKLVEVITTARTSSELRETAAELGKRLRKTLVPANDVAGFIGNGHFMRDGLHGINAAEMLAKEHGWPAAVYMVNRVSNDFLLRPMGIFQLIDYVGIDVFELILRVMNPHHPSDNLHSSVIDKMLSQGVKGGQAGDGSQRDGFFQYQKGRPYAVWNIEEKKYELMEASSWRSSADNSLGELPQGYKPWKALLGSAKLEEALKRHFEALWKMDTLGAKLARAYIRRSKEIGDHLVKTGVADSPKNVNDVLTLGFYHLYGPINEYIKIGDKAIRR